MSRENICLNYYYYYYNSIIIIIILVSITISIQFHRISNRFYFIMNDVKFTEILNIGDLIYCNLIIKEFIVCVLSIYILVSYLHVFTDKKKLTEFCIFYICCCFFILKKEFPSFSFRFLVNSCILIVVFWSTNTYINICC